MSSSTRLTQWIDGYRRAWDSNDPADIATLFASEAVYLTGPSEPPWTGREAIVAGWLDIQDAPGDHDFEWWALVDEPELAIIQGRTRYPAAKDWDNLWVIRFDAEGRATEFTEWAVAMPGS